jgi:glycosyltransferase involved in cell wall biosynthesis
MLYLPLAFDTPWKDEIRTVYPTKAVEYLVSGTPILLHAPADSYTAQEARELGWALVVDRPDTPALQDAIRRLAEDGALRESLVSAARKAAEGRDARGIAEGLMRDLGLA